MHEWSIADSIISTLVDLIQRGDLPQNIKRVVIQVGKLVQIDKDTLLFALRELSKDTPLSNTEFVLTEQETKFRCNVCGHVWSWSDLIKNLEATIQDEELRKTYLESMHMVPSTVYAFNRCPRCGSSDFDVVEGFDIRIVQVEA